MEKSKLIKILITTFTIFFSYSSYSAEQVDPIKVNWSFKGLTGKFDRSALQRGFQVTKRFVRLVIQCNILAIGT